MRALLAIAALFALSAPLAAAELSIVLDSQGRVVISDGTTELVVEGRPADLAYRILGLGVGAASSSVAAGTFSAVEVELPPPAEPTSPWLAVRSEVTGTPAPLGGATISGAVLISLEEPAGAGVTQVRFFLDGSNVRTESTFPWDFAGGQPGAPTPWSSSTVTDGPHEIRAEYDDGTGSHAVVAAFLVANSATGPPAPVDPPPPVDPPASGGQARASVESDGIEWHFAGEPICWQFVNGDWWVPPGTVVASVSPGWDGSRGGSMVNPVYINDSNGEKQGYDSDLASFSSAVRATFPLTMQPGMSLVSTWSWRAGEDGAPPVNPTRGTPRPLMRRAAVLTCTEAPPLPGEFRPPYAGTEKWRQNASQLVDLGSLPEWPLPAAAPAVASVLSNFDALWLDHRGQWHCQFYAPSESMPDYDRNQAAEIGDLLLLLCSDISLDEKHQVAIRLCQVGIDQLGVHRSVALADWGNGAGGHGSGRRAPVIVTGHLLGWPEAKDFFVGRSIKASLETVQVARDAQGLYWRERTTNTRADPGKTAYRKCCTACAWIGHVLAIRALGLEAEWSFVDSFPYQDEYEDESGLEGYERAWHGWHGEWWESTNGGRHAP